MLITGFPAGVFQTNCYVVARDGSRQQRPARRGQQADLVLVWDGQRWRVRDVRAPDGP